MIPGQQREDHGGRPAGVREVGKRDEEVFGSENTAQGKHAPPVERTAAQ